MIISVLNITCLIPDYSNIGKNPDSLIIIKKNAAKVRFGKNENYISSEQNFNESVQLEIKGKICKKNSFRPSNM